MTGKVKLTVFYSCFVMQEKENAPAALLIDYSQNTISYIL